MAFFQSNTQNSAGKGFAHWARVVQLPAVFQVEVFFYLDFTAIYDHDAVDLAKFVFIDFIFQRSFHSKQQFIFYFN